jgi:DNA-binding XRE family transcriptional regulator
MRKVQYIKTPAGDDLAVLPRGDFEALLRAAEDAEDAAIIREGLAALESGEEVFPDAIAGRLIAGENPVRVFREWRGLTQPALAKVSGLSQSHLSLIESGRRGPGRKALARLAEALGVSAEDLV